ncbi:MAG: hypothetical protein KAT53_00980 [Dehalococcoidia bacterium]|nr:hypothetical protein [Dehalococcoidia bacterium]
MKLSVVILLAFALILGSCVSPATESTPAETPEYDLTPSTSTPGPSTPTDEAELEIDPIEEWWLKPQSYTYKGDVELTFNTEGGFLTFTVPRLRVWDVVVIE